jgi:hypothetical protein
MITAFRNVAVLSLLGWYLMYPPTSRDLDRGCKGKSEGSYAEVQRCNVLRSDLVPDAPLSKWEQVGEFDTAVACQRQFSQNLHVFETREGWMFLAESELKEEGNINPTSAELSRRADAMAHLAEDERVTGKCVASDDPRLK